MSNFFSSIKLSSKETKFKKFISIRNTVYFAILVIPIMAWILGVLSFNEILAWVQVALFYFFLLFFVGFLVMPWQVERYIVHGKEYWARRIQNKQKIKEEDMVLCGFWICPQCKLPNRRNYGDSPCYSSKNRLLQKCNQVTEDKKVYPYMFLLMIFEL